jgi:hypothetical protein
MSLGLKDLKNKTGKSQRHCSQVIVSQGWAATSRHRPSQGRRRLRADAAMNEDWVDLHTEPIFWIDLDADSRWAAMMEKLSELEERVQDTVRAPLNFARTLLSDESEL